MANYYPAMPPAGYYDYSTSTSTSPSPDEYARYPPPRSSKRHVRTASYTPPRVSVWQSPSPYGGSPAYYNVVPRYSSPPVAAARYDYVSSPELPAALRSRPRRSSASGTAFEVQSVDINGKTSRRTSLRLPTQRIYVDVSDDALDEHCTEPVYLNIAPRTTSPQSKSKKSTPKKKTSADRTSSPQQAADYALVDTPVRSRARRASTSSRARTSTPPTKSSSREPVPATASDAARHKIPAGYSLKNWDPSERPILLLGSVFDANSLGKWIYDWTVYHHGPGSPLAEVAGDLWLLLIKFGSKMRRAEEASSRRCYEEYWGLISDFRGDGNRLWRKLVTLLKVCEDFMWQAAKKNKTKGSKPQMGEQSGVEFVKTIFGRDRELPETEQLIHNIRTWNFEYDNECDSKLRALRR